VDVPVERPATPRVREVVERVTQTGHVVARSDGSHHPVFPVGIPPDEGAALREWVIRERAVRTVEVGFGYGVSALFVCEGLLAVGDPAARHVVIDPHQATRFANVGLQLLEDAGVSAMVEPLAEDSRIALPRLMAERQRFDLAFVDGNHRFDGVFVDLVYLGLLLRPGGVVFLDDHQLPAVQRAVSFFVTNRGWTVEATSDEDDVHGWAVIRTSTEPDERPYHHFADF
jgi:predicted O-methyltransferase YrrM